MNQVTNDQLATHLNSALQWLAVRLKWNIITDEQSLTLTASQREYNLSPNFGWMVWTEWNGNRLTPKSSFEWERDGTLWRTTAAARPSEFAVLARTLIMNPPPDAASISTSGVLKYRFIGAAPQIPDSGPSGIGEMDVPLLINRAAVEYLSERPSEENAARIQQYNVFIAELLPAAIGRYTLPQEEYYPSFRPFTGRLGAAR